MAASVLMFAFLFLCCSLSSQYPQTKMEEAATSTNSSANSTAVRCSTPRGLLGTCLERHYCDYGTYAIDLSLYAPKGYKTSCGDMKTCCPFDSQLALEPKNRKDSQFEENDD